jgi:outer membrane protein insertion porin family
VFAKVTPDPRFLEEDATLDLIYNFEEGSRYSVGKIDVVIKGEYPHTKITTMLNRLSLHPGDIVDMRELRASERRIKGSQLYNTNPAEGEVPKIDYRAPESEEGEEIAERKPKSPRNFRGQSPDMPSQAYYENQDRALYYVIENKKTDRPMAARTAEISQNSSGGLRWLPPRQETEQNYPAARQQQQYYPAAQQQQLNQRSSNQPQYAAVQASQSVPANADYRNQVFDTGNTYNRSAAGVSPVAYNSNDRLGATSGLSGCVANTVGQANRATRWEEPVVRAQYTPSSGGVTPVYRSQLPGLNGQATAPSSAPVPSYNASLSTSQPNYVPVGSNGNDQIVPAQSNTAPANDNSYEYNAAGALPPPERPVGSIFQPGSPVMGGPPDGELPPKPLTLTPTGAETTTGRFMFGVGVNSDAGLFGSIVIDEQNFSLFRLPHRWEEIKNATAFRGNGEQLRLEAVPGTQVQRYSASWRNPYIFDTQNSLSLNGYYFSRQFTNWFEQRIGGGASVGRQFTPDLSGSIGYRGASVKIMNPNVYDVPQINEVLGNNALHGFSLRGVYDTRDNPFLATEGHLIDASVEQVIGSFVYPRASVDLRKHFKLYERPDGSGRHVLTISGRGEYTGPNTPIYENIFYGGFSSLRGFAFRGVSPMVGSLDPYPQNVAVGGQFGMLASAEYMFPITADDMLRGVVFCDTGTVEPTISNWRDKYRVAPGFGLRITVPAMGPAPIALDFAFPVLSNPGDIHEMFSFFVGFGR